MKIIESGHVYQLNWLDAMQPEKPMEHRIADGRIANDLLVFVNRERNPHPGTQTQEVLRALIDRTQHCDSCLRWDGNDLIIHHLRMALALHEARAILRKTEKGYIKPEHIATGGDGHFVITDDRF